MAASPQVVVLWPPRYAGPPDTGGHLRTVVHMVNKPDSTAEAYVVKVDCDNYKNVRGETAKRLGVTRIEYDNHITATDSPVELWWDRVPRERIAVLPNGKGCLDFSDVGGLWDDSDGINDGTGDILLNNTAPGAQNSYDIRLSCEIE